LSLTLTLIPSLWGEKIVNKPRLFLGMKSIENPCAHRPLLISYNSWSSTALIASAAELVIPLV
jgi:hypothetical protein